MGIKSKRPVGITILAIAQMWIGCLNLLFIPLSGLNIWGRTAQRWIEAHLWIRPLAIVGEVVLLVIYVGIGIGLWKLCPWARRTEIGLMGIGASFCIGNAIFFTPPAFAVVAVIWYCVTYGCVIFYLMRPRVRAAFILRASNEAVSATD